MVFSIPSTVFKTGLGSSNATTIPKPIIQKFDISNGETLHWVVQKVNGQEVIIVLDDTGLEKFQENE